MHKQTPIRIGNQTTFSALSPLTPFEYARENGFDAFEWFPDKRETGEGWEEKDLDDQTRLYIRNAARDGDIRLSVHAPWWADLTEPGGRDRILESLAFARKIGACLLNVHLYLGQGIGAYVAAVARVIAHLKGSGIRLSIENTPSTGPEDFNRLFSGLRDLKAGAVRRVGMCLDVGHANLYPATRNDYLTYLDLLRPGVKINHIHLHENDGSHDSHMPLFTGPAKGNDAGIKGLIERLKRRGFSGCIILEQWPQPPSLLNKARNRLLQMIDGSGGGRMSPGRTEKGGPVDRHDLALGEGYETTA